MTATAWLRALALGWLLVSGLHTVAAADRSDDLITVEPGRNWELVGEWDISYGGEGIVPGHYTYSLLRLNGGYVLVWDGTLIGGCCAWPRAYALDQLAENTFRLRLDGTVVEMLADASLEVRYTDDRVQRLPETPAYRRFSSKWK